MTDRTNDKAAARKAAFASRKLAHAKGLDAAANETLLALVQRAGAGVVAGYMPIRTEISPLVAMAALHRAGRRVCVPVIQGSARPLLFREWTPSSVMVDGPFGAAVPETGDWLEPELLVTPLVGFDGRGYRLGYGGGFYDRTFELLRGRRPTLGVGFAYAAQELPRVPTEPTDQPLDLVVTERGVRAFSPAAIALAEGMA